jgi:hypothetical protein
MKVFEKEVAMPLTLQNSQEALKNVKPSVGDLANPTFGQQRTDKSHCPIHIKY